MMQVPPPDEPSSETLQNTKRIDIDRWACLNCGQQVFVNRGDEPPEICDYCEDMTTWQSIEE